ncbi:2-amino-4-hydroxy-6-hydroxymethyldihydropteridine diphosphokinase [Saccharomonospora viridis]|jgi:2-amino-4-hydroxy-6-hydroxymethyldihydropteridine diphosphokinase|uniref:2-amino-4-hydroxy-6-hydroxymethyldihydropteridine diphosphokinase n=1 Tax=Saccharomonospora viridis (strain ATCC 15386 / DSM 43017 / JCM 3036 / CCUG 5913 / NBRC 12207 / NCIMB 9602 / P101) TaxID=471857 RepID=C7MQJ0_SACVD|nr:2-amino-4-hydroxy-6-hydroxymethyldihydropteridine diphosphokinase [Saccharomonospora viridis]ACU98517.1 2-amino-4-hydroxy-6-hydroxymethyldihydropteridine pyrophosphokinase [Saccharomonospora viridis DSM 43017]
MSRAVLSLGSNLGDRVGYLRLAVDGLRDVLVAVSSVYETKPWGVTDQPDFLNAVCIVDDPARDHWAWLRTAQELERRAQRVRERRWGPRTLDVDVVTVDAVRSDDPELLLPHPGAHERSTVLIPWLEIDPDAEVPGRGRAADLLAALDEDDRAGVRLRADVVL